MFKSNTGPYRLPSVAAARRRVDSSRLPGVGRELTRPLTGAQTGFSESLFFILIISVGMRGEGIAPSFGARRGI